MLFVDIDWFDAIRGAGHGVASDIRDIVSTLPVIDRTIVACECAFFV